MNFKKQQPEEYYLYDTGIANIFIDVYMANAPGDYVKVYMFALMYTDINLIIDNSNIAKHLGMDIEDVLKAWTYWEEVGIIIKHYDDMQDPLRYVVEFVDLKGKTYGRKQEKEEVPKRLQKVLANDEFKKLYKDVEYYLGRALRGNEPQELLNLVTNFHIPAVIVENAFKYAKKKYKSINFNAAARIARDWSDRGFKTADDVAQFLDRTDKRHDDYKRIMFESGKKYNTTPEEKAAIDKWIDEYGYTVDGIIDMFKRAKGINNPFVYVETIIRKERAKGTDPVLTSSFVGEVIDYYSRIRQKNEEDAKRRQADAYSKVPKIKRIDAEIMELGSQISNVVLSSAGNKEEKAKQLNRNIASLNAEKVRLLRENGFAADYMDIKYRCNQCRDHGYLDSGERCSCFNQRMSELKSM